jgi:hypothetical protein
VRRLGPCWLLLCLALVSTGSGCGAQPGAAGGDPAKSPSVASPTPTPPILGSPTVVQIPAPTATPAPYGRQVLGKSWQGRCIVGYRFGTGPRKVVLVGDIHGATEENTYRLALEMVGHFRDNLGEIPPEVTLWILPTVNPDGLENGTRCNAHMVDLNRNAYTNADSCVENDWAEDTHATETVIEGGGGPYPFSEVETQLLRDFLRDAEVAIFYHSMAGKIYVTTCDDHPPSDALARCLAQATGYPFAEEGWKAYPVSGAMVDYLAYQGVAAVEVELETKVDSEFQRNLAGVRAVLQSLDQIRDAQ